MTRKTSAPPATVDLGIDGLGDAVMIGAGGFGTVYRARDLVHRRDVAVKIIGTTHRRKQIVTELTSLGRLSDHPNITTIFRHGMTTDGRPYIVMTYHGGGSLAGVGPLPPQDVVRLGIELCGAIETAHRRGIIHRDIKPANVLLDDLGRPSLADFGIARILGASVTSTAGQVLGTLHHSPPELLRGEDVDARADIYSLGSTLYALLAGHPPHAPEPDIPIPTLLFRIVSGEHQDLRDIGVGDNLAGVVDAALALDPAARPATAERLGQLLAEVEAAAGWPATDMVLAVRSAASVAVGIDVGTHTAAPGDTDGTVRRHVTAGLPQASRRRSTTLLRLAVVLLLAGAASAALLRQAGPATGPPPPVAPSVEEPEEAEEAATDAPSGPTEPEPAPSVTIEPGEPVPIPEGDKPLEDAVAATPGGSPPPTPIATPIPTATVTAPAPVQPPQPPPAPPPVRPPVAPQPQPQPQPPPPPDPPPPAPEPVPVPTSTPN